MPTSTWRLRVVCRFAMSIVPIASPFQHDPAWRDLLLFNEYFHAENGLGLGAMHQTGWTGLVANLVQRRYRDDIPAYWRQHTPAEKPDAMAA